MNVNMKLTGVKSVKDNIGAIVTTVTFSGSIPIARVAELTGKIGERVNVDVSSPQRSLPGMTVDTETGEILIKETDAE